MSFLHHFAEGSAKADTRHRLCLPFAITQHFAIAQRHFGFSCASSIAEIDFDIHTTLRCDSFLCALLHLLSRHFQRIDAGVGTRATLRRASFSRAATSAMAPSNFSRQLDMRRILGTRIIYQALLRRTRVSAAYFRNDIQMMGTPQRKPAIFMRDFAISYSC